MKITFLGAGSTVFAKNVLGDIILTPEIKDIELALYDIDPERMRDTHCMLQKIIAFTKRTDVKVISYIERKEALRGADFAVNAIQVGGYEPCTVTDFEIPKRFGLRQTIGDTLGVGGIFRALRTYPVMIDFVRDMEEVCPNTLFLNYVNPMAILTGAIQRCGGIDTVGLCHSVQVCVPMLLQSVGMDSLTEQSKSLIAGINHQAWLLKIEDGKGNDLYPEIKRRSRSSEYASSTAHDKVRMEIMKRFGYYNTESSEHTAEYSPYFIKNSHPELIERFSIPLDEYPRRCVCQIEEWKEMRASLVDSECVEHIKSREYVADIIRAIITDNPVRINGNVQNTGLITNLPYNACVEVPCMVDRNGVNPCYVGKLPEQLAALNRTNINVQLMTIEACMTGKRDAVYQACYLDPHTASELTMDEIVEMCDELIEKHGNWLPKFV